MKRSQVDKARHSRACGGAQPARSLSRVALSTVGSRVSTEEHFHALASVDLAAVRNPRHQHEPLAVVDRIHNAIIPHSNSKIVASGQLRDPVRSRVIAQAIYRRRNSLPG